MPPFNTPGRGRKNSAAYKRGNPAHPTRDGTSPGPPPKRRLSNASAVLRPFVHREQLAERTTPAQSFTLPIHTRPALNQEDTNVSADVALPSHHHVDHGETYTGAESGPLGPNDSLFTDDEGDTEDEHIPDEENDIDGEGFLGEVVEKKTRSIKEIMDSVAKLQKQLQDIRNEAVDLGVAEHIRDWLSEGNRLRRIYRGDKPLTAQQNVINELVAKAEEAQKIRELLTSEEALRDSRDFTLPGTARPMTLFEKGVYDESITIEEALIHTTPLRANPIDRGRTWAWPAPVMQGARVEKLVEDGRDWNPKWKSLDGPHLNLDNAIRRLRTAKEKYGMLTELTPNSIREDTRRALATASRRVNQIILIQSFFANGYTVHPNQLVGPAQLPLEGFCTRSTLYILAICFRRLISIRDRDKKIGLHMSPIDFLRWRLAVMCKDHNHKNQALNRASIGTCLLNVYTSITERTTRGGDPLFREVMIYATKVDGTEWHFTRRHRRSTRGAVTQSQQADDQAEDSGDEDAE
jgi:hypothetical protein